MMPCMPSHSLPFGLLVEQPQRLLEAPDLGLRLLEVAGERLSQLRTGGVLRHLRQRLGQLLLAL